MHLQGTPWTCSGDGTALSPIPDNFDECTNYKRVICSKTRLIFVDVVPARRDSLRELELDLGSHSLFLWELLDATPRSCPSHIPSCHAVHFHH